MHVYIPEMVPKLWCYLNKKSEACAMASGWWQRPEGQGETEKSVSKLLLEA